MTDIELMKEARDALAIITKHLPAESAFPKSGTEYGGACKSVRYTLQKLNERLGK